MSPCSRCRFWGPLMRPPPWDQTLLRLEFGRQTHQRMGSMLPPRVMSTKIKKMEIFSMRAGAVFGGEVGSDSSVWGGQGVAGATALRIGIGATLGFDPAAVAVSNLVNGWVVWAACTPLFFEGFQSSSGRQPASGTHFSTGCQPPTLEAS